MSPTTTELISDPLFQLNALLWLTQPLPPESSFVPLLYQQGFSVYAVSPALAMPLDLQIAARQSKLGFQPSGRPDVILAHQLNRKFAFVECKASSFGPDSSTAEQARTYLLVAGPRTAEILGLDAAQVRDSLLTYLVPESQRAGLMAALDQLSRGLADRQMPTARASILGLHVADPEVNLTFDTTGSSFFSLSGSTYAIIKLEPDTDPRPLYFIPYDPDVTYSSEAERAYCKRILFERIHSSVLVAVGRCTVPANVQVTVNALLNDAMFGMYGLWENRDSARHMRGLCRQLMHALTRAVNTEVPQSIAYDPDQGWRLALASEELRTKVIDALSRFSCETMNLRAAPEPDLFDGR